jgi:hypothetical protein
VTGCRRCSGSGATGVYEKPRVPTIVLTGCVRDVFEPLTSTVQLPFDGSQFCPLAERHKGAVCPAL